MEVPFTAEQERSLGRLASAEGVEPSRLVQSAVQMLLEEDERFRAGVRKGMEQADRGEFLEEAEMESRIAQMLNCQ